MFVFELLYLLTPPGGAHCFCLPTGFPFTLFGSEEHTNNQITVAREAFTTVVMETNRKRHNI